MRASLQLKKFLETFLLLVIHESQLCAQEEGLDPPMGAKEIDMLILMTTALPTTTTTMLRPSMAASAVTTSVSIPSPPLLIILEPSIDQKQVVHTAVAPLPPLLVAVRRQDVANPWVNKHLPRSALVGLHPLQQQHRASPEIAVAAVIVAIDHLPLLPAPIPDEVAAC